MISEKWEGAEPRGRRKRGEVGRGEETPLVKQQLSKMWPVAAARSQEHALLPSPPLPAAVPPSPCQVMDAQEQKAGSRHGESAEATLAVKGRQPWSLQAGGGARWAQLQEGHRGAEAVGARWFLGKPALSKGTSADAAGPWAEDRNLASHPLGLPASTFTGAHGATSRTRVYRRRQGPERRSWNHPSPLSILSYQPCDKWH